MADQIVMDPYCFVAIIMLGPTIAYPNHLIYVDSIRQADYLGSIDKIFIYSFIIIVYYPL